MDKPFRTSVKTWSTPEREEARLSVPCALCGGDSFVSALSGYVRCTRCALVQVNPQPVPEAVSLRYDTNHGGDYLEYEKANEAAFLRLQEFALTDAGFFDVEKDFFPAGESRRTSPSLNDGLDAPDKGAVPVALDIGCAAGAMLLLLKNRGWDARGVEISGPQAAFCRSRGLDVSSLPLEENHFPSRHFDAVLASHVIEHLNDPFGFAAEARRILKPGGRFYVTTPNIAGFQARISGSRWRSAIFDHLYLFSEKTLYLLLEKAGFKVERIKTWGGLAAGSAPPWLKTIFDKLAKLLGFGDVMIVRAVSPHASFRR